MFTRRSLIRSAGATAVGAFAAPAILRAQSWFAAYPFTLGVAAGDPAPDGFVIWTRLAPDPTNPDAIMPPSALPVQWEVAGDNEFGTIVAKGETLARPELGHSVHVDVTGLQADRPYWYRFIIGKDRSMRGRARTLPAAGASAQTLRFGVCGCQNYEDGFYTAYRHLAAEQDLAFVFHYGDFIYEYKQDFDTDKDGLPVSPVRHHIQREPYSVDEYRRHYAQYLSDMDLQAARASHGFLQSFDDHELHNNWAGEYDAPVTTPEVFLLRKAAAMQAWYEHMPVRGALFPHGGNIAMNRRFRFGDLAAINVLDTRSFRTDQPCGDNMKPACPEQMDPKAAMMGSAQEAWLDANLHRNDATWNCIAQQVMMMPLDRRRYADEKDVIYNMDSWAGYDAPRRRLMSRLAKVDNAVVLTGDEHQNFAGLLLDKDKPVAVEAVLTSISSGGDGQDLRKGSDKMLADNPQLKFINDQRGYGLCEVTPEAWKTHFMVMDKVSQPGGTISRRTTATMPRGEVSLSIG
ncbi:alkaline phosphatase D family protein [Sphingobium nicotianae]|uniref:Alkaline phosphatase D family protein n=1 Tax=Sphingobium nicotianae TaxID=2782607 RepID=A0A9X1AIY1_9SPHN|nr:alkaline phosphatase D family protein [Sphingobium nicotianae]MBT2185639.1 alkaline phosphatase D family protein [Sphingobium nicotianae]